MERLILFDIDGTLLSTDGVAGTAFLEALTEVFGRPVPRNRYSFAGKTDTRIAADLLARAGIPEERVRARLPRVWPAYLHRLEAGLAVRPPGVLPGVHDLLRMVDAASAGLAPGLLTGNVRQGAALKLAAAGIDPGRFRVGAFGCDHPDRRELPALAARRALELLGRDFPGRDIVIVGDTPADIGCGEALGVITVAVATGRYSAAELARHRPDHLFPDLSDTEAVLAALHRPPRGRE